jgi:hypothetical protein
MEPNLAESIYVKSSIKFLHFVPFRQQIWPPRAILVSDWLLFPGRLSFSYADLLAFFFSVEKSIGSGCFFPDLDLSVNLIGLAAITEMIKL